MIHFKNIVVFIVLWAIGYALGDGVIDNYKDYLSMLFYVGGIAWLFYRYG